MEKMSSKSINLIKKIDPDDSIPKFFAGKSVFITGGSGFMGKVLIEKLLRTCPKISNIYVLLRPKYGDSMQSRLDKITNNVLFDTVKEVNPKVFKKLIPVPGDLKVLDLGIPNDYRQELIENVSIVYHVAATVRFDETLQESVIMNTRGTRDVCHLVLSLKKVDAFMHVSTAYCHYDKREVHEELYSSRSDWRKIISIVENTDPYDMKLLSPILLDGFPNAYTFSKALAEVAVKDLCQSKIPTIIFRPTIVISIWKEPMPGWVDNINGPVGLMLARAKGILRSNFVNYDAKFDFMPVDMSISAIIKATWIQQYLSPDEVAVYNSSSQGKGMGAWDAMKIKSISEDIIDKLIPRVIWYPSTFTTDNKFVHLCCIYMFHLIPAILVDLLLRSMNKPPRLLNLQRKIFRGLNLMEYFPSRQWFFHNDKFSSLDDFVNEVDKSKYNIDDVYNVDHVEYFMTTAKVVMELILKEDLSNMDENLRHLNRMKYIHYFVKSLGYLLVFSILFKFVFVPFFQRI